MENKDHKLDYIISQLRKQQPELHDAGLLTDNIMKQVAQKSHQSKPTFLIWVRAISSSAAVLLLGLFIFQQTNVSEITADTTPTHLVEHNINIDFECAQNLNTNKSNMLETYLCHMVSNSIKNKQFQSYNQLLNN